TVPADLVPDLAHQVRTHPSLLQQVLPGKLRRGPLGSNRNQRCGSTNQDAARKQLRSGNANHFDFAAADLLKKLFHIASRATPLKTYCIRHCTMANRSGSRFAQAPDSLDKLAHQRATRPDCYRSVEAEARRRPESR